MPHLAYYTSVYTPSDTHRRQPVFETEEEAKAEAKKEFDAEPKIYSGHVIQKITKDGAIVIEEVSAPV